MIDIIKNIKWKYEIGEHITNNNRDSIITGREIRKKDSMCNGKIIHRNNKWYECLCNNCYIIICIYQIMIYVKNLVLVIKY